VKEIPNRAGASPLIRRPINRRDGLLAQGFAECLTRGIALPEGEKYSLTWQLIAPKRNPLIYENEPNFFSAYLAWPWLVMNVRATRMLLDKMDTRLEQ